MIKTFSITGWSNSGKTTLLSRLVEHFKAKGKRVVTVKYAHKHYYLQPESKDTFKFLDAGSDRVYLAAQKELVSMKRITGKDDVFATIEAEVTPDNCDFLLLEGLRRDDIPMIEVFNTTTGGDQKFQFEQLAAIVSEKPVTNEIPNFNIDDIKAISEFMEAYHEENRSTKNK